MINVIVPIVSDVEKFSTFIKGNKKNGVKFFVGIKQSLAKKFVLKSKNVDVHIFSDKANHKRFAFRQKRKRQNFDCQTAAF